MSDRSRNKRSRRSGRGSVMLIAALLVGSAVLRLGAGTGGAFAEGRETIEAALARPSDDRADSGSSRATEASRDEMQTLLHALQEREARVDAREKQIAMRTKTLEVANTEVQRRLDALKQAESALRATLALADSAAEKDIARLTAMYESMKAKDAAPLFEAMEPKFAAGFLGLMRPDAAAAILTGMAPEAAYTISILLAGRNAKVPKS